MINPEQFRFFADMLKETSGLALTKGKEYLLESRLNELAKILGLKDLDALYQKAKFQCPPKLKEQIIEAMTTNETYFFRDQHPFDALQKNIIPEVIKKNSATKRMKIWSAACSTGQEPYTIAMILAEHFSSIATWNTEILATDISKQAVQKGREGRFTQVEVNRGLPITMLIKYFKQEGAFWIADAKLKKNLRFQPFNLMAPFTGKSGFDIILCRYVLIYFDPQTKKQILGKLTNALAPGGFLMLGATETPIGLSPNMKRVMFGKTTCWQKQG
jgi:chemotaxis protein methyltransferase CheR